MLDSALAKALSIREALSWIKLLGMHSVLFEVDALIIVNAIKHNSCNASYLSMVIDDCISLLKDMPGCQVFIVC